MFPRPQPLVALAAACLLLAGCPPPGGGTGGVRSLALDSDFVFVGTGVLARSSTIDAEDVNDLAVVRVDQIVSGAPVFQNLSGQQVTLRLRNPGTFREGEQRVWFTRGWHYGESIGVVESGNVTVPSPSGLESMRSDIQRFRQEQADSALRARIVEAEAVVAGRVTAVRPSTVPRMITEHDPEWREADIAIVSVLKGTQEAGTITVLFPGTDDPMWRGAPRLAPGMEGVFLLHREVETRQQLPHLALEKGIDLQSRSDEARVRRLMQ